MLTATLFLLALGLLSAVMLVIAAKVFYVEEDPRIEKVTDAVLGANCGGCGYAGCAAAAEAVVKGLAGVDVCVAGGYQCAVNVAAVMGLEVKETEPLVSLPGCRYNTERADTKFEYNGFKNCQAAMLLYGGAKECGIGCLGLGSCASACAFGAITMVDGLPVVNADKCTGCGVCEKTCPKGIITLSSHTKRMTTEYTADECTAPCQRTCPAGINIPAYIKAISEERFEDAVRVIREKNPMISVCGYICPSPCEFECRRTLQDNAVAINPLKKFLSDYERKQGAYTEEFKARPTNLKVAIIGGGAQGLSAANFLSRLGHEASLYELLPKLGGLLRYAIGKERLPEEVLDWDIRRILDHGVKAHTEVQVGKDYTLLSLLEQGNSAVLITNGGMDSRKAIQGPEFQESTLPGVNLMIDFLLALRRGLKPEIGKAVCIVEGGPSAVKTAQLCRDLGAEEIHFITANPAPAQVFAPDVIIHANAIVSGMRGSQKGVQTIQVESRESRAQTEVLANSIISASGRLPEWVILPIKQDDAKITGWQVAPVYKAYSEKRNEGIFCTVEPGRLSDYTAVVKAVGAGRKLAGLAHRLLTDGKVEPQKHLVRDTPPTQNVTAISDVEVQYRTSLENVRDPQKPLSGSLPFETGFSEASAVAEASRCMDCGLVCYKSARN